MSVKEQIRSPRLARVATYWLVFVTAFVLAIVLYDRQLWPWGLVQDLKAFAADSREAELSVTEALANDLGGVPERHVIEPRTLFSQDRPYRTLDGLPLSEERGPPRVFLAAEAAVGYRLIHGTFAFEEALHGAVLLGPDGVLVRYWPLTQEDVDWNHRPDANVVAHGIDITRDGALIVAFDGGTSLRRVDWCGDVAWIAKGGFHHSVDLDGVGGVWTWGQIERDAPYGRNMLHLDAATGAVLRQTNLREVIDANPDVDIFGIRQEDTNRESRFLQGAWHVNDLEALPPDLADANTAFVAGDLLASYRNVDLVFVMDPQTLRVKWWRQGLWRRQHDPDFNARGTISVYDNNMHRGLSRIVDIDPVTYVHRTVVAGADHDFYSWRRGKHQELPDGSWLVASTEQGRAFEVGPEGRLRFEFLNDYDDGRFLPVAEALWLPLDWFENRPACP